MAVKQCSKCNKDKPVEQFNVANNRTDGRHAWCKECVSAYNKAKYYADPTIKKKTAERNKKKYHTDAEYRNRLRMQSKTPEAKAKRKEHRQRPEAKAKEKAYQAKRDADPTVRARAKVYAVRYAQKKRQIDPVFKLKEDARSALNVAVRRGLLVRPAACQHPGRYAPACAGPVEAHHHRGYAREFWLDVVWLCVACHKAADAAGPTPAC